MRDRCINPREYAVNENGDKVITYRFIRSLKQFIIRYIKFSIRELMPFILVPIVMQLTFGVIVIPTESMYPTIKKFDIFIINNFINYAKTYERGDIVTLIPPQDALDRFGVTEENIVNFKILGSILRAGKFKVPYVKRLIALEGDTFRVENGIVYVNEEPLNEEYLNEKPIYEIGEVVIPEGMCIVLGDNRNNSLDSSWFGEIPIKSLGGKLAIRVFPFNRIELLD